MHLKKTIVRLVLALVVLHLMPFAVLAAEDKLGFIDAQRVLVAHPKYEESQKQLDEFTKKNKDEMDAAVEKATDPREKGNIQIIARTKNREEEVKVMNPIEKDIKMVIEKVAKSKGVTVVITKILVYFGGVDLTDDVVKSLKELKF